MSLKSFAIMKNELFSYTERAICGALFLSLVLYTVKTVFKYFDIDN